MLFEINKEPSVESEEDKMNIDEFLKMVEGSDYLERGGRRGGDESDSLRHHQRSYYELLFEMK